MVELVLFITAMIPKKYLRIFMLMWLPFPSLCSGYHPSVAIGVVLSQADWNTTAVKAVDEAVEMINRRDDVLPGMRLIYSPIFSDGNSFKLGKTRRKVHDICKKVH